MKLKNKITLLTSAWVVIVLLFLDLAVYLLFIRTATENEIELLRTKSNQIIEKIGIPALFGHSRQSELRSLLPQDTAIRIVTPESEVANIVQRKSDFFFPPYKFSDRTESELTEDGSYKVLVVRVPIYQNGQVVGTFELIEKMVTLGENLKLLVTILFMSTIGAIALSLLGGILVSRTIMRPITRSTRTMEDIERSLAFKQIPSEGEAEDELHQMTQTFNRMMGRLEESFQKQQQFVSDASHELNTMLTIIEGYADMLRRRGDTDEAVRHEAIANISEETGRMKKMTQQLLSLASSEQDAELHAERIKIYALCKQVTDMVEKVHRRIVRVSGAGLNSVVYGDPNKIKQLLLILIDNALKYSKGEVEVSLSSISQWVEIRVKDLGIGIPKDQLELVFERFYRVDQARRRKTGGTGLGLPIAKAIVEEHGGTIEIESEEGKGTEVIVRLPTILQ